MRAVFEVKVTFEWTSSSLYFSSLTPSFANVNNKWLYWTPTSWYFSWFVPVTSSPQTAHLHSSCVHFMCDERMLFLNHFLQIVHGFFPAKFRSAGFFPDGLGLELSPTTSKFSERFGCSEVLSIFMSKSSKVMDSLHDEFDSSAACGLAGHSVLILCMDSSDSASGGGSWLAVVSFECQSSW